MSNPAFSSIEDYKKYIAKLEAELKVAKRAQIALDASGFDIWENNFATGEAWNSNKKLFAELGYTDEDQLDNLKSILSLIHPDDYQRVMAAVDAHFNGETERYKAEFRVKAKNGNWLWMGNHGQIKERNEKGEVTQFIGVSFNIDQRRMMEETMKTMAFSDALTGLGNRRLLFEKAGDLIAKSYINNLPTTLLIADIDYFKKINDTYGHTVGDQVLIAYSKVLKTYFREIDMKIRYGGDEFIILLPDTSSKQAEASAHRLNDRIAKINSDVKEGITTSVGLAELQSNETIEHLIKRADKALYRAKQLGRNTVVIDS